MKPLFAALLLVGAASAIEAAAPPDSGSLLQQTQPVLPHEPSPTGTGLRIEQQDGATAPASAPLVVQALVISGNERISTAILHALVADAEGKTLTLPELQQLADRITEHYEAHGYPLARAIIPAQTIHDGVVEIQVIEARYGEIQLDNQSRVKDPLLEATLAPLQSGHAIAGAPLDHALLLLSDIPGVAVSATLQPGETVGTSDLQVITNSGPAVSGTAAVDDYGNRYTGRARAGGMVNLIDPLHRGDVLSLSALTSGSNMNYGRIDYESVLNGSGLVLGAALSALHYRLGDSLGPLDSTGTATVASGWAKDPLVRSRDFNLYAQLQYDRMQLDDELGSRAILTDRHLDNGTLSLNGDARDALVEGGVTTWSLGWTVGHLGFDDTLAQFADAHSARTEGRYDKWNASMTWLQRLGARDSVYIALSGQRAEGNLDSAQKMNLGGIYTVRAYDMGAISGDSGYLETFEWRHDLFATAQAQWQIVALIDNAHMQVNQSPWVSGSNSANLSGAGAGLNWSGPSLWHAEVRIATPIGHTPVLIGSTNSTRVWAEIGKSF